MFDRSKLLKTPWASTIQLLKRSVKILKFLDNNYLKHHSYFCHSKSIKMYDNTFEISGLRHEFQVIRLWEQPVAAFAAAVLAGLVLNRQVIRRILRRDIFGDLPSSIESQLAEMSVDRIEVLSEVLLNFSTLQDLETWLQT
jgi:hypothetical protein